MGIGEPDRLGYYLFMVKPTVANTNHKAGVFYFTRAAAEQVAAAYAARIEKTTRGFVLVLADGSKLGPANA